VISFIVNIIVFEHKKNVCVERMFEDLNWFYYLITGHIHWFLL
jgi:hypothetical protein